MPDLTEFLLARIGEDAEGARRIVGRRWYACDDGHVQEAEIDDRDAWRAGPGDVVEARLPNHHNSWALVLDPTRVLAECEAKRRVVESINRYALAPGAPMTPWHHHGYEVLRMLALPHADHPDYLPEWRL